MTLNKDEILEQFSQLLNEEGDFCDYGCTEEEIDEMVAHAKKIFPTKPCCVVSSWCWADIEVDPQFDIEINAAGFKPCFIYANTIISDELNRWGPNSFVRTSLLVEFHPPCIFSSRNTNYILCGNGVRLKVVPAVFSNFMLD